MTKREQNVEAGRKFGAAVNAGGVVERFFGYVFGYIVVLVPGIIFINSSKILSPLQGKINESLGVLVILFLFALPFVFWERSIRKFRRKNGLSVYGDIKEELEQREINERVAKEHKAFVANEHNREIVAKKDLDYWFGLLQKGAITEDEYNVKKSELITA